MTESNVTAQDKLVACIMRLTAKGDGAIAYADLMANNEAKEAHADWTEEKALAFDLATKALALRTPSDGEVVAEIEGLIDAYWGLAFTEGSEGRTTDTPDGAAQDTRAAISRRLAALRAAAKVRAIRGDGEVCQTCFGTGMEGLPSLCRDCDDTPTDNLEAGAGDLAERLLKQATYLEAAYGWTGDIEEAAAQLASVTAERDEALALVNYAEDISKQITAENVRLREALERATADLRDIASNCTGRVDAGGLPALVAKCGLDAIAALSQEAPK